MAALAEASALSASRITRLVDGFQRRGLVTKERCAGDARGTVTALTDDGMRVLQAAYPVHLASVRRHLFDRLERAVTRELAHALQLIAADSEP